MTDESWPAGLYPTKASFSLLRALPQSAAPFATTPRVTRRPGEIWMAKAEFGLLTDHKWGELTALFDRIGDRQGIVRVPSWDRIRPARRSSSVPPVPETVTAGGHAFRGEEVLRLTGLAPETAQLGPGDRLSVAGRLYRIKAAAPLIASAGGDVDVPVAPALREDVLWGDEVRLIAPVARMKIASTLPAVIDVVKGQRGTVILEFIEAGIPSTDNGTARLLFMLDRLTNQTMPDNLGAPE